MSSKAPAPRAGSLSLDSGPSDEMGKAAPYSMKARRMSPIDLCSCRCFCSSCTQGKNRVQTARVNQHEFEATAARLPTFHESNPFSPSGIDHLLGFSRIDREWLFTEDMLAGGDGIQTVLAVQGVRCPDVDNVDLLVGVDAFVVVIDHRARLFAVTPYLGYKRIALLLRGGAKRGNQMLHRCVRSRGNDVTGKHSRDHAGSWKLGDWN